MPGDKKAESESIESILKKLGRAVKRDSTRIIDGFINPVVNSTQDLVRLGKCEGQMISIGREAINEARRKGLTLEELESAMANDNHLIGLIASMLMVAASNESEESAPSKKS